MKEMFKKKKKPQTISRGNTLNFKTFFGPLYEIPKGWELLNKSLCRTKPRGENLLNVLKSSKAKQDKTELYNLETGLSAFLGGTI